MPEKKTLNEDLFYKGSSANLPHLHTCKNKVPFWDFSQFAVTIQYRYNLFRLVHCVSEGSFHHDTIVSLLTVKSKTGFQSFIPAIRH